MLERIHWEDFAETKIPFISCQDLAVFKVFFDRTKDWADLEAMHEAGTLDGRFVTHVIHQYLGDEEPRLARLADNGQLLAVTHSPQVAARGRTHYMIAKSSQGTVTKTGVVLLDEAGRQEEIARMLSGAEVTPEARAQADRLLEGV